MFYDRKRDPVVMIDKPLHSLHFYIPRTALNAIADDVSAPHIGDLNYCPGAGIADNSILCLGQSMLTTLCHPERASRLFVDQVTLAVATHVAQAYGEFRPATRPIRGGLAPWQVKRRVDVDALIDGTRATTPMNSLLARESHGRRKSD